MKKDFKRVKFACYTSNITMAIVGNFPPLLFLTFRHLYEISYSLLGTMVLINFVTQLIIDLIFSFFSHKFNIPLAVKTAPVLGFIGLCLFALWPLFSPETAYIGLVVGTVIFSASSGFCEVLISPVIAAIPTEDPDREMSKLHSAYAWGAVGVIVISTIYILLFGEENWHFLALAFTLVPISSILLFAGAKIPEMQTPERISGVVVFFKNKWFWLCVFAIFLGGSAECSMAQWCSGYIEKALGVPKLFGDIFGVALFSVMLGIGRTLYAKFGKKMTLVLLWSVVGTAFCYLVAAITTNPIIGLLACGLTGLCTSMLWPGNLVVASECFPTGGVFLFAMMAAGGDLGASVGPQLLGIVTDLSMEIKPLADFANLVGLAPDQLGMKLGMFAGMLFPLCAIPVFWILRQKEKKRQKGLDKETVFN